MNYPMIAMVHIHFRQKEFLPEHSQDIEAVLRREQVYHLTISKTGMTFYIWGQNSIDYGILKNVKKALLLKGYPNFIITADEYVKTGQMFTYDSQKDSLSTHAPK